ncbi:hypothetical protein [Actinomyces oricola]
MTAFGTLSASAVSAFPGVPNSPPQRPWQPTGPGSAQRGAEHSAVGAGLPGTAARESWARGSGAWGRRRIVRQQDGEGEDNG